MKETSPDSSYIDRIRSWAITKAHGGSRSTSRRSGTDPGSILPISRSISKNTESTTQSAATADRGHHNGNPFFLRGGSGEHASSGGGEKAASASASAPGPADHHPRDGSRSSRSASPQDERPWSVVEQPPPGTKKKVSKLVTSFLVTCKKILLHSWLNVLLIFIPVGIIVNELHMSPALVFSMNALAIIPLAGLLGHATEAVAHSMGDAIGALLNVTFGNAVELIIFIALVKDEIRIVQASLLGSILANLLLILGMGFLLGGLRYREQIYNSTITQTSACLLSLSVISLVLPTAFHASFANSTLADQQSLRISRGTSVVLLLVYGIYLFFQLKSHAYMYESTPQHIIDEATTPGPAAGWLDSSSSEDGSSSSDSDDSDHSRGTMSRTFDRLRGRNRKSSVASQDTVDTGPMRTPSFGTTIASPSDDHTPDEILASRPAMLYRESHAEASEVAVEDERPQRHKKHKNKRSLRRHKKHKKSRFGSTEMVAGEETIEETPEIAEKMAEDGAPRRIDFALSESRRDVEAGEMSTAKRPFNIRGMSFIPSARSLAPTVFTQPPDGPVMPPVPAGPVPRVRYGIRRTNSLPDRLNQERQFRPPGAMMPSQVPLAALANPATATDAVAADDEDLLSRKAAVILLLVTTGLVALCAEFMVASINGLVADDTVGEIFIGLIILPIVGNAAEHVTAVMVAMKNKMDLAIGVAIGSSIQIALFMTPLVVILGWIIGRDMTLYFTLFETVCLFVSAFIVNFLVLDGRSNYLEGALLCATYVIISVVAFYYPKEGDASQYGQ